MVLQLRPKKQYYNPMDQHILGNGQATSGMGVVVSYFKMEEFTKDSLLMTEQMDMEDIFIQMVNIISATGKMIMLTVKVYCAM